MTIFKGPKEESKIKRFPIVMAVAAFPVSDQLGKGEGGGLWGAVAQPQAQLRQRGKVLWGFRVNNACYPKYPLLWSQATWIKQETFF